MNLPVRNRYELAALGEADVKAALARIASRDVETGEEARHVYDTLTWGEGPGQLCLAGVQDWLWYRLPTKYFTDEEGYMGRLARVAAELFDELGLGAYAQVCRSETTAGVHAAFERSDSNGFKAMVKAQDASGIAPPDLDDFSWGEVMGVDEATAFSVVQDTLERAVAGGDLVVGGRGWRSRQKEITAETLDADHPERPGQSWRTLVVTERVQTWVDRAGTRSGTTGRLHSAVANRLLNPIAPPPDVAQRLRPVTWLLGIFGESQLLTQAGYLNTAFVRMVQADRPWEDPFPLRSTSRSEADDITLGRLRELLERVGALRKRGKTLRRTRHGAQIAVDPVAAWSALGDGLGSPPWNRFVAETAGLVMLDRGGEVPAGELVEAVAAAAAELGWRTSVDSGSQQPSEDDVSWAFSDTRAILELCGMLEERGDWRDRRYTLTPAGETTVLAMARKTAAGPRQTPR